MRSVLQGSTRSTRKPCFAGTAVAVGEADMYTVLNVGATEVDVVDCDVSTCYDTMRSASSI